MTAGQNLVRLEEFRFRLCLRTESARTLPKTPAPRNAAGSRKPPHFCGVGGFRHPGGAPTGRGFKRSRESASRRHGWARRQPFSMRCASSWGCRVPSPAGSLDVRRQRPGEFATAMDENGRRSKDAAPRFACYWPANAGSACVRTTGGGFHLPLSASAAGA